MADEKKQGFWSRLLGAKGSCCGELKIEEVAEEAAERKPQAGGAEAGKPAQDSAGKPRSAAVLLRRRLWLGLGRLLRLNRAPSSPAPDGDGWRRRGRHAGLPLLDQRSQGGPGETWRP